MDELEPLPDFAKRLVDEERKAPAVSSEAVERVLGRVERTVGLAGAATGVALKLVIGGAGIFAGVAGTLAVLQLNVFVPDPIVLVQRVEVPVVVQQPPAPVPAPAPVQAEPPRPRPKVADSLDAEQRLLDTARAALVQQRPEAALEAVRQHAKGFPNGQLAEERDALEVQALWKAGRDDEARRQGAAFRRRFPQSIFNAAIDALEKSP